MICWPSKKSSNSYRAISSEQEVRATTAPIELEGFYLGRFEIRLQWERIHQSSAYRVVALDPQPSSQRKEVTHPHVSSEYLCEGEGRLAIRSALDQGRIGDFFLIVLNLLRTYSPGNAYVELEDWDGVSCSNCDASCSSDELYSCHSCERFVVRRVCRLLRLLRRRLLLGLHCWLHSVRRRFLLQLLEKMPRVRDVGLFRLPQGGRFVPKLLRQTTTRGES